MKAEKGKKVKVDYVGTFEDGTEFDSSAKHGQPLEFEVGAGQMIKGFDAAVDGMEVGQEKEITLAPEEAYGQPNEQLVQKVPKDKLPEGQEPQVGMMLTIQAPDGKAFPARITDVSESEITIDLNHPLAGKTLKFKITLVEVA